MNPVTIMWTVVQHCWYRARDVARDEGGGGTTIENVAWYIAAALGVVVVAAIIWAAIKAKASQPLPAPTAP